MSLKSEWLQEKAEIDYENNKIDAMEFRQRMYALGFTPRDCDDMLDTLDDRKQERDRR